MAYSLEVTLSKTQTWRNQDERRYELSRDAAEVILPLLSARLPVVRYGNTPPITLIATLYFDTADGYYLRRAKSTNGISSVKIRSREYLPISDDAERKVIGHSADCYLERKERTGTIRQKDRLQIAKRDLADIIDGKRVTSCHILQSELQTHTLVPAVISMYERRVWGSDTGLRITFDERIRYYRPTEVPYQHLTALQPSELGEPAALGPKRILEVKHSTDAKPPAWLIEILADMPEAAGFSKFLDGMAGLQKPCRNLPSLTRPVYKLP